MHRENETDNERERKRETDDDDDSTMLTADLGSLGRLIALLLDQGQQTLMFYRALSELMSQCFLVIFLGFLVIFLGLLVIFIVGLSDFKVGLSDFKAGM